MGVVYSLVMLLCVGIGLVVELQVMDIVLLVDLLVGWNLMEYLLIVFGVWLFLVLCICDLVEYYEQGVWCYSLGLVGMGDMYGVILLCLGWYLVGKCIGLIFFWVNKLFLCGQVWLVLFDLLVVLQVDFNMLLDLCDL